MPSWNESVGFQSGETDRLVSRLGTQPTFFFQGRDCDVAFRSIKTHAGDCRHRGNDTIWIGGNTRRNPGWKRGIRIGSAKDGWVTNFIPDSEPNPDNSATSGSEGVAVDAAGNIYGAEVGPRDLKKYVKQ